jgi:hypothetical protein
MNKPLINFGISGLQPTRELPTRLEDGGVVYFDTSSGMSCDSPDDTYCRECCLKACKYRQKITKES